MTVCVHLLLLSRHKRQTWWSSLRPQVDVPSGGEADSGPPHRLEVPLHVLRPQELDLLSVHHSVLLPPLRPSDETMRRFVPVSSSVCPPLFPLSSIFCLRPSAGARLQKIVTILSLSVCLATELDLSVHQTKQEDVLRPQLHGDRPAPPDRK